MLNHTNSCRARDLTILEEIQDGEENYALRNRWNTKSQRQKQQLQRSGCTARKTAVQKRLITEYKDLKDESDQLKQQIDDSIARSRDLDTRKSALRHRGINKRTCGKDGDELRALIAEGENELGNRNELRQRQAEIKMELDACKAEPALKTARLNGQRPRTAPDVPTRSSPPNDPADSDLSGQEELFDEADTPTDSHPTRYSTRSPLPSICDPLTEDIEEDLDFGDYADDFDDYLSSHAASPARRTPISASVPRSSVLSSRHASPSITRQRGHRTPRSQARTSSLTNRRNPSISGPPTWQNMQQLAAIPPPAWSIPQTPNTVPSACLPIALQANTAGPSNHSESVATPNGPLRSGLRDPLACDPMRPQDWTTPHGTRTLEESAPALWRMMCNEEPVPSDAFNSESDTSSFFQGPTATVSQIS